MSLSDVSVGRMLKKLGLSAQRPLYRAYQAEPEAFRARKDTGYPQIIREAKKDGATIYFAAGLRFSVSMISAIIPRDQVKFFIVNGTLNAPRLSSSASDRSRTPTGRWC